jgi:hypothetical protein
VTVGGNVLAGQHRQARCRPGDKPSVEVGGVNQAEHGQGRRGQAGLIPLLAHQDETQVVASAPGYFRMLTARATISATVTMETTDCKVMASLAQRDSGSTSVGLNAAALVNARYR